MVTSSYVRRISIPAFTSISVFGNIEQIVRAHQCEINVLSSLSNLTNGKRFAEYTFYLLWGWKFQRSQNVKRGSRFDYPCPQTLGDKISLCLIKHHKFDEFAFRRSFPLPRGILFFVTMVENAYTALFRNTHPRLQFFEKIIPIFRIVFSYFSQFLAF